MTTTTATDRARITDAKTEPKDRALKKVWLLENLIFHPRTGAGEREAAERMLDRALAAAKEAGVGITKDADDNGRSWHGYRLPEVWYGARYEEVKHMSLAEIAKRIREDIKLARKVETRLGTGAEVAIVDSLAALAAMPKGIKVSVTSTAHSIRVRVYNLPEKGWGYIRGRDRWGQMGWVPGEELDGILRALKEIHGAYNFDGSDATVEYYHRNYFGHVEVDWRERP
jgi:hypothetical protein